MSDDLVEGLRLVGRTFMPELMHGSANEIERLRAEVSDLRRINQVDGTELRALCAARDMARRTSEYWKAEHIAGNAVIDALRARIDGAPVAVMDTRASLGICAPTEEDFPAIYALPGKRVALVVVDE